MSGKLASRLREGTQKSHSIAENAAFVQCFLKGAVERHSYRQLLGNFYFVYCALEEALGSLREHSMVGQLYFPELHRQDSLEQDLTYYWGSYWQQNIQPSKATQRYINRIQTVAIADPILLIAHAYTRYLGDLSGGQILKKIAQRGMNLPPNQGTHFYDFEDIPDPKAFKAQYRHTLDRLPVDERTITRVVDEANFAFKLNMALFQELEGSLIKAIGQLLFNHLTVNRHKPGAQQSLDLDEATTLPNKMKGLEQV